MWAALLNLRPLANESPPSSVLRIVSPRRFWLGFAAVFLLLGAFLFWCSVRSGYPLGASRGPYLATGPHDGVMEGRASPGGQLDPCRDMYEYVCHNWSSPHGARTFTEDVARSWERLVQQTVLAPQASWPATAVLGPEYAVEAVRHYHNSCVSLLTREEKASCAQFGAGDLRTEALHLFVALNSTWGILLPDPTDEDVVRLLLLLSLRFGLAPVLRVRYRPVGANKTQLLIELSKAPLPTDRLPHGTPARVLAWCAIYMRIRLADEDMTEMVDILRDMMSLSSRAASPRGAIRSPEVLAHLAPSVPAHVWITAASKYAASEPALTPPGVLVRAVSTVRSVLSVLLKANYREMVTPFLLVQSLATVLGLHIARVLGGRKGSAGSDDDRCLRLSRRVLSPVWNVLYSEAIADHRFAPRAETLVHELKLKLRERVQASGVLDEESRITADNKLAAIRAVFPKPQARVLSLPFYVLGIGGYRPRDLPAPSHSSWGGFLAHTMTALAFLQRTRRSPERGWLLTRQQSPHVRLSRDNELCVPAAQLREPFASGFPFLDLATLGTMAAQQMLQAVGERGSHVDETGTARDWWTARTRQQMWQYVLCIRQVYLSGSAGGLEFSDADVWDQLASAMLALQTAFELAMFNRPGTAASNGRERGDAPSTNPKQGPLTMRQRFFVRFCRGYCEHYVRGSGRIPGRWICNSAAKHLAAFADSFNCPDDAPMVPKEICAGF
ncbi:hypothetical protein HPB50_007932 [Hyalomma asiaticum]|uniref:Uncharacterized protein n=1 Tax=Hyalomma asiaticum TaxID=266040 RepID=A0ACB7SA09_HYAAI|nr:hypothetical protein HPB50_007932 [Hyalomma asiaticum]